MPLAGFAAAIFTSAFLLFWLQPLYSKMVLPLLGGSPSVWNVAMMFFQLVLLAGYGYAHILIKHVAKPRVQVLIHSAVVASGLCFLPFAAPASQQTATMSPLLWLVGLLAVSIGWPFFALSTTTPLLQAWFARSRHRLSGDPYFLYAASNLGSLLALVSFPLLLEPQFSLVQQSWFWLLGYAGLLLAVLAVGFYSAKGGSENSAPVNESASGDSPLTWRQRLTWIALAFVPSSLLLGVTTHITTDIASVPLFWVLPLALYLLSFVIAFSRRMPPKSTWVLKAQAAGIIVIVMFSMMELIFHKTGPILLTAGVNLATFFITAVICHTELAKRRPNAEALTGFYLCMSIGGAAGGVFNALIAPVIFSGDYEYYLALVAACMLRVFSGERESPAILDFVYSALMGAVVAAFAYFLLDSETVGMLGRAAILLPCALLLYGFSDRAFRFALAVATVTLAALLVQGSLNVLTTERNFFGINKVRVIENRQKIALLHGTTMHGTQFIDPRKWRTPLSYYARSGPVGQVLFLAGARRDVAVVGLGSGALACYRKPGDSWTFFEIDGAVEKLARDTRYFHYLSECGGDARVVLNDGRLALNAIDDRKFDLLIIDAFSSDAIPMHLLTKEAVTLYLRKLKPGGIILFHISNIYLDLAPVLTTIIGSAHAAGLHQLYAPSPGEKAAGASSSEWMVIAADKNDLAFLAADRRWDALAPSQRAPWTDDFSNIFQAIKH
jgi:hypothetical protein